MAKPNSNFGLVSGIIGLTLCFAQTIKGHHDAASERERLQESHEQKMHFLHEFHRQQLHAKEHEMQAREHRMSALEMERRAQEAERRAETMVGKVLEGRFRVSGDGGVVKQTEGGEKSSEGNGAREEKGVWRLLEAVSEKQDDCSGSDEGTAIGSRDLEEMEENRQQ